MLNNQVISVGTNAVQLQLNDVKYSAATREYICQAGNQFNTISQSFALVVQSKYLTLRYISVSNTVFINSSQFVQKLDTTMSN